MKIEYCDIEYPEGIVVGKTKFKKFVFQMLRIWKLNGFDKYITREEIERYYKNDFDYLVKFMNDRGIKTEVV